MGRSRLAGWCIGLTVGLCLSLGATLLAQAPAADDETLIGVKNTKYFHKSTCSLLKRVTEKNKVALDSPIDARAQGFKPCPTCLSPGGEGAASSPKGKLGSKKGTNRPGPKGGPGNKADGGASDGALRFSRDIAPILVANCSDCHTGAQTKGQFNLSTFNGLMKGGKSGQVIVPKKPEASKLVELLEAGEMPRGNNRKLSEEAVAKISSWVKTGAILDPGLDPAAELKTYAATPEQLRKDVLTRMTPDQLDKKAEEVALERWKKASSKVTPEATSDKHFILFGNLPKDRAKAALKVLEAELARVAALLGPKAAEVLGPEKISVYVFNEPNAYVEFVRAVENREVEPGGPEAHGRFDVETPYLAAADPLNGKEEPKELRKPARGKREEDSSDGPDRSLAGVLAEPLASTALAKAGKPPRWLAQGYGAYMASQVEPRSPYFRKLRTDVIEQARIAWKDRATSALGGEGDPQLGRAFGFSLCEWLATKNRLVFDAFLRGMLEGGEKLDSVIEAIGGPMFKRDQFLDEWGSFVAFRYASGARRR